MKLGQTPSFKDLKRAFEVLERAREIEEQWLRHGKPPARNWSNDEVYLTRVERVVAKRLARA